MKGSNKPVRNANNPVVFFDVELSGHSIGRIKIELFSDIAPKNAEAFRILCTGEKRVNMIPVGYKGCEFHRVIRDFMVQGGDLVESGGITLGSDPFTLSHDRAGLLSTANEGTQFFITCGNCHWLDNKHVVFGQVLDHESMLVVRKIENLTVDGKTSKPKMPVKISECGQL